MSCVGPSAVSGSKSELVKDRYIVRHKSSPKRKTKQNKPKNQQNTETQKHTNPMISYVPYREWLKTRNKNRTKKHNKGHVGG